MRHLLVLIVHLMTILLRLLRPGGLRTVVAEPVLAKHQLLILNRSRRRGPNLRVLDRFIAGLCSLWIRPNRLLFSPKQKTKPGPKRADGRLDPRRRRDETAQFDVGMASHHQMNVRDVY